MAEVHNRKITFSFFLFFCFLFYIFFFYVASSTGSWIGSGVTHVRGSNDGDGIDRWVREEINI